MIKVTDIAYVRFTAPDLDLMEKFAVDFGLVVAQRTDERLFCRGTDPSPYVHVTERGEVGFGGVAFDAASAEDLASAAQLPGASAVEALDDPGGGSVVRFADPDGFAVEIVHGREALPPLPLRKGSPLNDGSKRRRLGELQRLEKGPAQVKRLGHIVLRVSDFAKSADWYQSRFGFIESDRLYLGDKDNVIAAFMRVDRGATHVDHHTMLCLQAPETGFDHAAFEVEDFDALMLGNDHLAKAGYEHKAGIGRHILGSQIFDYWLDPWGHTVEHYTDGDLIDSRAETGLFDPVTALGTQWGKFAP